METKITDTILTRFLANDLSVGEQEQVAQWIAASPENRRHFLALQQAWELAGLQDAIDQAQSIDVEEKWAGFRQSVEAADNTEGEEALSAQYVDLYGSRTRRTWLIPAIAASVLVVLGLGWLLLGHEPTPPAIVEQPEKETAAPFVVKREVNNTGKDKVFYLPDSSRVTLADKSEISYRVPFANRRAITLTGKADFKVTHDAARPFTVYSKEVLTTVLGTQFTVTAWPAGRKLSVRLYEGRVVVRPVDALRTPMNNNVFLVPGQEFTFDGAGKVSWFRKKKNEAPAVNDPQPAEDPLIPDDTGATWYMFNNQPLEQVLQELSALYGVKINYNKRDVGNSYFTAKYRSTDTLETILERIARLNKLTITKDDNGYKLIK